MNFLLAREQSRLLLVWEGGSKVLLTNSSKKRGPKEAHAGTVYGFAHQAYWGFRFLATNKKPLWQQVLSATTREQIQEIGKVCSVAGAMARAGYGAAGMMEGLKNEKVAMQAIAAKNHRRYPRSERPSSQDRRMIFLAIAVAAGVWDIDYKTALRKLTQAKLGIRHLTKEVHRIDHLKENMRVRSIVWAEPVGNYFLPLPSPNGEWELMQELPCKVPSDWRGGFIIHGVGPSGPQSTFSRTLPLELREALEESERYPHDAKRPARKTIQSSHRQKHKC
jgi:hypothetical protein